MRPIEVTARIIFKRACALGCEGLVSKHLGSPYRAWPLRLLDQDREPGRTGVKREAEEIGGTTDGAQGEK
jgi:hypothetical protein